MIQAARWRIAIVLVASFALDGSWLLADGVSVIQQRLRQLLEQRREIGAIDVELTVDGYSEGEYSYRRRALLLNDRKKDEMWPGGNFRTGRRLSLFDGSYHAAFDESFERPALLLTDRELVPETPACRVFDPRFIGLIPWGLESSLGPEDFYFKTTMESGNAKEEGAVTHLSWTDGPPDARDQWDVKLDGSVGGELVSARLAWRDKSGEHRDELRVDHTESFGRYFPSQIYYEHFDGNQRTRWENVTVSVKRLGSDIDASEFSLSNAEIPKLTQVAFASKSSSHVPQWWDGSKVVGIEEIERSNKSAAVLRWVLAGSLGVLAAIATALFLRRRMRSSS